MMLRFLLPTLVAADVACGIADSADPMVMLQTERVSRVSSGQPKIVVVEKKLMALAEDDKETSAVGNAESKVSAEPTASPEPCTKQCNWKRKDYGAVCGFNGQTYKTYKNDCMARCENVLDSTVGPCYIRGDKGNVACPDGFEAITNKTDCEIAATEVGITRTFRGENNSAKRNRLPHCWIGRGKFANYNANEANEGVAEKPRFGKSSLICKKSISPTCDDYWTNKVKAGCCEDTNADATGDPWGVGGVSCSTYAIGPDRFNPTGIPDRCTDADWYYDDEDFSPLVMCCGCGGGNWEFPEYWPTYHLSANDTECDAGVPVRKWQCLASVEQLATKKAGDDVELDVLATQVPTALQQGTRGKCMQGGQGGQVRQVPQGCSAAQSGGDWAAYYKSGKQTNERCVDQQSSLQLVCTGPEPTTTTPPR